MSVCTTAATTSSGGSESVRVDPVIHASSSSAILRSCAVISATRFDRASSVGQRVACSLDNISPTRVAMGVGVGVGRARGGGGRTSLACDLAVIMLFFAAYPA